MIKGDHLISPRVGFEHHGLYIGNREVIHYSGFTEGFGKGFIEITSIEDFEQGRESKVKNHIFPFYDANERVERACSRTGENSYDLLLNNCEHFVNWCFNGVKSSSQVNNKVAQVNAAIVDEYVRRNGTEIAASIIAQQVTRTAATQAAETAITSTLAKSTISTAASTVAGATAVGVVSAIAAGSLVSAAAAAPVAIAVGAGYGVKKLFDWIIK
ncbi:MAG: lecithin retinol acyltransferase family protein [Aliivibrio sp.]|uniref:lecithin retinol acyltransferase family protein n=1 Tax=Aliivibrio sp. TaxID=1872443 RepID=UPI001A398C12|nr:lecithin retinol acyltransferase family protein [Aliivibrio sp.]